MLLATASTAAAVTQSAILASALGLDHRNVVFEAVKGWCGNEPRVIPWPTTWPFPFPWPEPDPEPWYRIEDIRLTAALVLHDVALRMHPDSDVRATLMEGAFELADSAGI